MVKSAFTIFDLKVLILMLLKDLCNNNYVNDLQKDV